MHERFLNVQVLKPGQLQSKVLELGEGATVGDILKKIAALKDLPLRDLYLCEDRWPLQGMKGLVYATCTVVGSTPILSPAPTVPSGITVKLLKTEVPEGTDVQLGGVDDLDDLPDVITVEAKTFRTSLTREDAAALQDDLILTYSDEEFQKKLQRLRDRVNEGKVDKSKYGRLLGDLTLPLQKKTVLPKWGFEASPKGVMHMISSLDAYKDDQEQQTKTVISRGLLGLNFEWLNEQSSS
mmetsp:Transcript_117072/g.364554  ORF Transcript_117072/g.364554 Transcript_117072/m.364554 type:complete len:239 (+) Transcript_117072:59-775(+)|eukprot:CAMPEP_0204526326 /NCGR_PEP_ID=MMETSP0661-20131031/8380_1 /ASSEMBLY_ACC=CAM_ASM_000606 /TAXON_ID=109239 /ORGANISM="Alexandrium margalefi, Strain AMGDE01CS-322" /LENGTH=238 /DNA_ID=CAMNT_0051532167 /DNA_START=62 /DNA_END=778 /DNA_ORIENTATION=+